jgi:hypothetical protein
MASNKQVLYYEEAICKPRGNKQVNNSTGLSDRMTGGGHLAGCSPGCLAHETPPFRMTSHCCVTRRADKCYHNGARHGTTRQFNIRRNVIGLLVQSIRTAKYFEEVLLFAFSKFVTLKAIHVAGCGGLYGCEKLNIPHYLDSRLTYGGKIISPTRRPRSISQYFSSSSGTHFC